MLQTVDAHEIASETLGFASADDRESEEKLSTEIMKFWAEHTRSKADAKRTRSELKNLRRDLGERLHAMKTLLARTGRDGQWMPYLREHKIPRTTADRYVREHEHSLNLDSLNCTTGAISGPTEADVTKFFRRLLPQLRKVLTSQQAVFDFVCALVVDLPGVRGDVTDLAVEIYRPTQKSEEQ